MAGRYRNIDGVEKVEAIFSQVSRKSAERLAIALNKGGDEIAERAEDLAPVGSYRGAGDLQRSIEVVRAQLATRADGRAVVVRVNAGTTRQTAQAAFRQEFGRRPGPGRHPGHAIQDFFWPAYWSLRARVRARVKRELRAMARALARYQAPR